MKTIRVTLISDPTDEYPQNQSSNFKMRLPVPLNLPGPNWHASLWSVSVPDAAYSSSVIHSNKKTNILNYRYTLTKRYVENGSWTATFASKDKSVRLKDVMSSSCPVQSGQQLWQNIMTHMEQTMMEDVKETSDAWKTTKGNTSTVSLKSTWKPTFEWRENTLVLKKVACEDVFGRTPDGTIQPLSAVGIHVDLAEQFGLLIKDKNNAYQLGPNIVFALPTTTYGDMTPPRYSNTYYQWLGEHVIGIKPRDLGGSTIFKVKQEDGQSYLYLTRAVDWHFYNLNALFNTQVGTVKQSVMVYCDAVESTIMGAQRHSLLRKVELDRAGKGRAIIEPYHREWIRVRN